MSNYHLAQVNVAHLIAPQGDPRVQDFFDQVPSVNALAESSPGFVWRFEGDYPDPMIAFNLSVWESIEDLRAFVYRTAHVDVLRRKDEWFTEMQTPHMALWWQPAGDYPSASQALTRLENLTRHGDSQKAFRFSSPFPKPSPRFD